MTIRSLPCKALSALLLTAVTATAMAQAPAGNAEAGQAKAVVCGACHGPTGNESPLPNTPKLGGQGERYLLTQLQEIKGGVRVVKSVEEVRQSENLPVIAVLENIRSAYNV